MPVPASAHPSSIRLAWSSQASHSHTHTYAHPFALVRTCTPTPFAPTHPLPPPTHHTPTNPRTCPHARTHPHIAIARCPQPATNPRTCPHARTHPHVAITRHPTPPTCSHTHMAAPPPSFMPLHHAPWCYSQHPQRPPIPHSVPCALLCAPTTLSAPPLLSQHP
ncbi:hypothetical protein K439DRAFT_1368104 [Ramaria rubella]|nr:hypothetical protein K439DRAFT_1368104 [Ramaria rubella]